MEEKMFVWLGPFYPLAKFEQNRKIFLPRPGPRRQRLTKWREFGERAPQIHSVCLRGNWWGCWCKLFGRYVTPSSNH